MHSSYSWLLSDAEAQKNILRHDREKRLEGICAEITFCDRLLKTSFEAYSSGWWFLSNKKGYYLIKLCANGINSLTVPDHTILEYFSNRNVQCWVVEFCMPDACFYSSQFTGQDLSTFVKQWYDRRTPHNPKKPLPVSFVSSQRKEAAITFIQHSGLLLETALERLFANFHFKEGNNLWDVDYFALHNGSVIAFEMKQKYPSYAGYFGLNEGLIKLFRFIKASQIKLIHSVLTKPVWDEKLSAVEFLTDRRYWPCSLWLAAEFDDEKLSKETYSAPSKTSYSGNNKMYHRNLMVKEFSRIGFLDNLPEKPLLNFLNGKCSKVQDIKNIPRLAAPLANQILPDQLPAQKQPEHTFCSGVPSMI